LCQDLLNIRDLLQHPLHAPLNEKPQLQVLTVESMKMTCFVGCCAMLTDDSEVFPDSTIRVIKLCMEELGQTIG
jgi:hypothetical protein